MRYVVLLLIVLTAGTAEYLQAQDVRYNFDKSTDFTKYKTYKWVTLKDAQQLDDLLTKQIMDAMDAELAAKGLSRSEGDAADLYIGFQAALDQEKQFTSYSSDWGYGGGWGGGWYGGGGGSSTTTGQTSTIYTGQLAFDFYDSANKTLVWRGVVSKTLDQNAKPEKREKNLRKAINKLLKNYPPKPKT